MYPKNNASPEPIAIGPVVQISDGAVQTSGCTVRIKPKGVAEGDGAGTTAYSTDGIVLYTPSQAETNYTSFVLIAKKASCIPASITIVTSESATAGRVSLGEIQGSAQSATDLKDFADDGYDPSTNKVAGVVLVDTVTTVTGGATAAQINSLQINTRANLNLPVEIETPDASTQVYKIRLHLFDVEGNMEAPDSAPTVALTNAAGTDRSSRLSVASNPSTGVYTWDYTATAGDSEEQLVWVFTVVEGGLTRTYPATSYVVEESAYRFSSTDRTTLNAAATAAAVATLSTKVGTPAGASVSADIAAVKTDTGNLITRIPAALFAGITSLAQWLGIIAGKTADAPTLAEVQATTAGATYNNVTMSLEASKDEHDATQTTLAGIGGGTGTGARTITVTVNDGATALESAKVRFTKGAETYLGTTNASGIVAFGLDDGTWTVAITLTGYSFTPTTKVVSATGSQTYSMTAISVTASDVGRTTGYLTCYTVAGAVAAGVVVSIRAKTLVSGETGIAHAGGTRTGTSDAAGLVQFTNLVKGETYEIKRADGNWEDVEIPSGAGASYALPSIVGP